VDVRCWRRAANYLCLVPISSFRDWLDQHPPPDAAFGQSLAGVATRVTDGDDFLAAAQVAASPRILLALKVLAHRVRWRERWHSDH
jgi:hypothetical protein